MKVSNSYLNFKTYQPIKTNKQIAGQSLSEQYCNLTFQANPIINNKISNANKKSIVELINNFKKDNQFIEQLGKGSFGTAYKLTLPIIGAVVVKILNPENNNSSYGGGNLEKEAEILRKIPYECKQSQKLIDFFKQDNKEYLVTNFIAGKSLKTQNNISQQQMDNIIDELYKYDINGLMFYDLNADNIKVSDNNIGFFDFEFVDIKNQLEPNYSAFNDLHHIGRNLYHPQKSNINAFENRALGEFIIKSDDKLSAELVGKYLKSLSKYHSKMSIFYHNSKTVSEKTKNYEKILSRLYEKPSKEIISIEKDLIYLRSMTLNYYLYLIRLDNNALLEDDYKYYTNFNKFISDVNQRANSVKEKIDTLSNNSNSDIQEYCKVNFLYIDSLLKINCSKTPFEIDEKSTANKLKQLKEEILTSNDFQRINEFLELYNKSKNEYLQNKELSKFCDDIKEVLLKTQNFINA